MDWEGSILIYQFGKYFFLGKKLGKPFHRYKCYLMFQWYCNSQCTFLCLTLVTALPKNKCQLQKLHIIASRLDQGRIDRCILQQLVLCFCSTVLKSYRNDLGWYLASSLPKSIHTCVWPVPKSIVFSQKPGKLHSGTYTIENSLFRTWPLTLFYCILWSLMTHRYSTFLILSWFSCQTLLINWYFFHSKSLAQFYL